ncbi:ribosomal protein S5 domain 2-type protein [Cladochytrium replicatum]|nr:ribosomal protein S5 domain 2-type protein [Cladochytrium replicatum]
MDSLPSQNERDFVVDALLDGIRVDGRSPSDLRPIRISFGLNYGHAEVELGKTRAIAKVSADIVRPRATAPAEGFVLFNTEFSPMASPAFEHGRLSDEELLLTRLLEKALRRSRAVDTEGLCIVAGEKVWQIKVDVRVLDHQGNLLDCACIAAIAALMHFRRPDVSVVNDVVTMHSFDERTPIPLSIHHIPVSLTFAFFESEDALSSAPTSTAVVLDPTHLEEQVSTAQLTLVLNIHRELCTVHKSGAASAVDLDALFRCASVAQGKAAEVTAEIRRAVAAAHAATSAVNQGAVSMKGR